VFSVGIEGDEEMGRGNGFMLGELTLSGETLDRMRTAWVGAVRPREMTRAASCSFDQVIMNVRDSSEMREV